MSDGDDLWRVGRHGGRLEGILIPEVPMLARWLQRVSGLKALVVSMAVVLVLVGILLPLMLPYRSPVTRAAYERIEEGTTQDEVEALLGGPPGDYRTRPAVNNLRLYAPSSGALVRRSELWNGDEGDIIVTYGDGGRVYSTHFNEAEPCDCGPLELARWRLERIKDKERWWK
jgi:hypothetical protein